MLEHLSFRDSGSILKAETSVDKIQDFSLILGLKL